MTSLLILLVVPGFPWVLDGRCYDALRASPRRDHPDCRARHPCRLIRGAF
jgi:hypothetical protein